jgi:anti-anti-sigma factor
MALAEAPTLAGTAAGCAPTAIVTRGDGHTLVSLAGEHDIATVFDVAASFAGAIALDHADLVVDLSKVDFMGAETVGILIRARSLLQGQSRSLTLQAPTPCALRVLDLCEFGATLAESDEAWIAPYDVRPG